MFFCIVWTGQLKAQGVDVIFWMDNSASIDATEWTNMSASTKTLIDKVLSCNPNNRAAVVHYGASGFNSSNSKIYIESDFSNNVTAVQSFVRRSSNVGDNDFAPRSLMLIGNALDNISNTSIVSPQKQLNKLSTNKLVIFLFTDANRLAMSSQLVSPGPNPFDVYNVFKSTRQATFVVLHADAIPESQAASAAIASTGGSYNGDVEANSGDPQGSGTKPRKAIMSSSFDISSIDISTITNDICRSCAPTVKINAVTPPSQSVCLNGTAQSLVSDATGTGTLNYQWFSNTINSTIGGTPISGANSANYNPPTAVAGTLYYYVVVSDSYCEGNSTSSVISVTVDATIMCGCYKDPITTPSGSRLPTKAGISALGRGGAGGADNWPMVRNGGWIALESKTKGFVVNRVAFSDADNDPATPEVPVGIISDNFVEGMMVYDTTNKCLKIYTVKNGGTDYAWYCVVTPACPD